MKKLLPFLLIIGFVIGALTACAPDDSPAGLIKQMENAIDGYGKIMQDAMKIVESGDAAGAEKLAADAEKYVNQVNEIREKMQNLGEDAFTPDQQKQLENLYSKYTSILSF